jgi:uncharacterized protein YecE (DUF72 family)
MDDLLIRARIDRYHFRDVHPSVHFGTASDRYAGWIGQIYSPELASRVQTRRRSLDGRSFEERVLPVESASEYFEHFQALEIDFTFYRPLLDADGAPTNNLALLRQYADHAPADARFILKAPQTYFARRFRRGRGRDVHYQENADFLNAPACVRQFLEPARIVLGDRLAGILFEQEYQRVADSPAPEALVAELDPFFAEIGTAVPVHIELRSSHLIVEPYVEWLADRGIGFALSHWTWLPPIRKQWKLVGERFTERSGQAVVRLLTPLNMPYATAYAKAHPFDRPIPEMSETRQARAMVDDVADLARQAARQGVLLTIIVNNRAWGNAPGLAQAIAYRIIEE